MENSEIDLVGKVNISEEQLTKEIAKAAIDAAQAIIDSRSPNANLSVSSIVLVNLEGERDKFKECGVREVCIDSEPYCEESTGANGKVWQACGHRLVCKLVPKICV
ncbi:hypothetical protein [Vibrio parahaemolyticus]|uniref:hypothetical protein n=1 Tax=Vibrio parahaemolyticus TaxID=670 RepID=UPI001A239F43|nr:hypothetical protein [Vibrio parahaemolyticus]MDG2594846.1 hypothetical protein [Vibrio parahaemolyticus]HAS6185947.1 hypothetical protein [Vibrio vulnificus]